MALRMYKYQPDNSGRVEMPVVAKIRKVALQDDRITLWAEVDERLGNELRAFQLIGTGREIPHLAEYFDTILMPSGLVWHVYSAAG